MTVGAENGRGLLWVNRVGLTICPRLPVFPRKRTLSTDDVRRGDADTVALRSMRCPERAGSDGLTARWSFPRGSFGTDRKARDQLSGGVRALNAGAARTTAALML
jgi:hypothetical protein